MKKKLSVTAIIVLMLALAIVGGSLAYFTDTAGSVNTFTIGNIDISLTECEVESDGKGNLVSTGARRDVADFEYGKLIPGMTVDKDPTITNVGSEDAYIAAKVIVSDGAGDIQRLIPIANTSLLRIQEIVSGGYVKNTDTLKDYNGLAPVFGDTTYSVYQAVENGNYVFYIFVEDALAKGEDVVLFKQLRVPAAWDNAEMAELAELKISVKAFAVQEAGFDTCYQAMTTAFETEFNF